MGWVKAHGISVHALSSVHTIVRYLMPTAPAGHLFKSTKTIATEGSSNPIDAPPPRSDSIPNLKALLTESLREIISENPSLLQQPVQYGKEHTKMES